MLESRPGERDFHKETLLEKLRQGRDALATPHLYTEERAASILAATLTLSEMFATGLTEVHSGQSLREKEREVGKAVVVAVMDEQGQAEVERVLHLFSEVFVVNLTVSGSQASQAMKVSPLRRRLKGFVEVSINFFPCLDGLFSVNRTKQGRTVGFAQGLTSYLLSLPKFHEFHLHFSKSDNNNRLSAAMEQTLNSKLAVLQRHGSSQYKESGSPRVSVLLIDRRLDPMSPLLYSYFYGPIAQELGALGEHEEFTTKSTLFSALFSMDLQEAGELLRRLSAERAESKKATMENKQVQQIKKAITLLCDTTASPREIQIHLDSLASIREFCQRRAVATALQQTILNNLSENGQKMSPSKIIDRLIEWAGVPLEEFKPSEEDYAKILMVAYMVNSFWFFHRKIINAGLKDHPRRDQVLAFCKRHQNSYRPLPEKPQGEERYDLYRHHPAILSEIDAWVSKSKEFQTRIVNRSSANRQTRRVIAVDGPLGYNEACFIQRYFKEKDPNATVTVVCSQLMNTKEYQEYLLRAEGNRP